MSLHPTPQAPRPVRSTPTRGRPPHVHAVPVLAAAWWSGTAATALTLALLGRTLPVGADVPDDVGGVLHDVPTATLTLLVTLVALLGAALATAMLRARTRPVGRPLRTAVLGGTGLVVASAVALTDSAVLARLGYLPLVVVRAPFDERYAEAVAAYARADVVLQYVALGGAVLLTWAAVLFTRRARGACDVCGRTAGQPEAGWRTPARAAVWGRRWALVAAVIPTLYAASRLAWVAGIPLGLEREAFDELRATGGTTPALGLALFALVGSVLTLGLFQRWGELFPRWMVGLAGRRVPVMLAVVPATVVAVAIVPASIALLTVAPVQLGVGLTQSWAALAPMLLWPLWGPALGAATYAYHLRRRGACATCGEG